MLTPTRINRATRWRRNQEVVRSTVGTIIEFFTDARLLNDYPLASLIASATCDGPLPLKTPGGAPSERVPKQEEKPACRIIDNDFPNHPRRKALFGKP